MKCNTTKVNFYSGFSLKNEEHFFNEYRDTTAYCISGFSYGAIKAFKDVQEHIGNGKRVDRLQLFSPAFFQTKREKFKKIQEISYSKNKHKYLEQFLQGCFNPFIKQEVEIRESSIEELHELLFYEWNLNDLLDLERKGVVIEVYLGGNDQIIDVNGAQEFFLECSTVTYIKNANHFLQIQ